MTLKNPMYISSILPKVLKPITKKFSSNLFKIQTQWEKIIGKKLSETVVPNKIYKINNKNILDLLIIGNNSLEISYQKDEILNKINNHFKFELVSGIKFKKSPYMPNEKNTN
tara:strand:- start:1100 stop:1435 length:336 start_codon:yes stop_codon:yes gene_type:complete